MSEMSKARRFKIENAQRSVFIDEIGHRDRAFVLFYATWCPFSQRFLPIFEEYASSNPQECISVIVDDKPDICEEYSIDYYPTVILFRSGKVHRRLDAQLGIGLNKKQLREFVENP
jgi:thiol-disulfide isomerase/thioredoxin